MLVLQEREFSLDEAGSIGATGLDSVLDEHTVVADDWRPNCRLWICHAYRMQARTDGRCACALDASELEAARP